MPLLDSFGLKEMKAVKMSELKKLVHLLLVKKLLKLTFLSFRFCRYSLNINNCDILSQKALCQTLLTRAQLIWETIKTSNL